jgi:hypothetical protein
MDDLDNIIYIIESYQKLYRKEASGWVYMNF